MNDTEPKARFLFSGTMKAKYKLTGTLSWSDLHDVGKFSHISHSWTEALAQMVAAVDTSNAKYYFELKNVEGL